MEQGIDKQEDMQVEGAVCESGNKQSETVDRVIDNTGLHDQQMDEAMQEEDKAAEGEHDNKNEGRTDEKMAE